MYLGRNAIKAAIQDGSIVAVCGSGQPLPDSRIQLVSVDVTLGEYFAAPSRDVEVDVYNTPKSGWALTRADKRTGIIIPPRCFLLAHTDEFIGSAVSDINCQLQTRSTAARWGMDVCRAAGWGDPGYVGRWTLELQNALDVPLRLLPGTRIGQITFFRVENPDTKELYHSDYNSTLSTWTPECMLPKNLVQEGL